MGIIVMGTPMTGKSTLGEKGKELGIKVAEINPDPDMEYRDIVAYVAEQAEKFDIVLIPYSYNLMNAFDDEDIDFDLFYHPNERRISLLTQCTVMRKPFAYTKEFDNGFHGRVQEIEGFDSDRCHIHCMRGDDEYIGNNRLILDYIEQVKQNTEAQS